MIVRKSLLTLFLLLVCTQMAFAFRGHVQSHEGASVHWGNGEVVSSVTVKPVGDVLDPVRRKSLAVREAAVTARKQMLDVIEQVRIDSNQTVGYRLAEDLEASEEVRMLLQNSPLTLPLPSEEGTVESMGEVSASISMRGAMAELLLPTTIPFLSGIPPKLDKAEQAPPEDMVDPMGLGVRPGSGYSGVIIDARGLDITPALCPVVYDGSGVGVYGPFVVSRSVAVNSGVAAYSNSDEWVVVRSRVGETPLVVQATGKATATDPVISASDAALARAVLGKKGIGDQARVVIVLDRETAQDAPVLDGETPEDEQGGIQYESFDLEE